jgi:hypothetical protein
VATNATVWDMAKQKRANRRAWVGDNGHLGNADVATIAAAAQQALGQTASNTQLTFVVARLVHPVTRQTHYMGFGIPVDKRPGLAQALHTQVAAMDWVTTGGVPNLHGEMSIVKYCLGLGLTKPQLGGALIIACVGKPVCADCCGWMPKHGISHGVNCSHQGSDQGWTNPGTLANFRGESDDDFTYSKSSKYESAATWLNKNPKQW